ncbi:alpha-1,3-mannosyl-glycoprotein beta-1, 2-n-acetylglucosaminyltransferase, putative [Ricinus communis]|uniref:Alpha-1,3-mannosyl-glycoprotein 2-beta-N-acetylglucosaminyltransferase n=1 Tax=Ricinus communis TaxID=3988 RepID=B9SMC6_RICCO|nr:alpha-1,3-mannosyl-glycoprotein beta-1, 2-n-acetylglucosaminyltransferase, putative [Ricinus communis]
MAKLACDFRCLLIPAAVAFFYIQMRLFATQSEYADRLASAIESENHCASQMRLLIDQISTQQGRIVAFEEERKRRDEECSQLKALVEDLERKGLKRVVDKIPVAAVVIMACNRADYLERTVKSILKYQTSVASKYPLFISQDGSHPEVRSKAMSYDQLIYMQHIDSEPVHPDRPGELIAYYKIARHYKWALDQLFYKHNFSRVIILEDDMEIAPDFFDYFEAAAAVLDKDKLKENHKGRQFIRPEVCRTYNFGEHGSSLGQFFKQYLEPIKLNDVQVDWKSMDLSYLMEDKYPTFYANILKNAKPVYGNDAVLKAYNIEGDVRIQYKDQADFERIASQFGIFEEWKVHVMGVGDKLKIMVVALQDDEEHHKRSRKDMGEEGRGGVEDKG